MVIKNLTSKLQYLGIQNLLGGRSVSVQVLPHGRRELAHTYIPDRSMMPDFDKIFEIEGLKKPTIEEETQEATAQIETSDETQGAEVQGETQESENPEESEEETHEESGTAPETNESTFICAECGAEFGSARGLASHQTRAHT